MYEGNRTFLVAGARAISVVSFAMLIVSITPARAEPTMRERLSAAVETIEGACATEVSNFCSRVTWGEGRLLLCMQAHEDRLGKRCQFAIYRASRRLEGIVHRVEQIADACWNDIETKCADAESIGKCVLEKRDELSQQCRAALSRIREATLGLAALRGMPVFSADAHEVGQVVDVVHRPNGSVQSIQVDVGQRLGIGSKTVTIDAEEFGQLVDQIRLRLGREEVMRLPGTQNK